MYLTSLFSGSLNNFFFSLSLRNDSRGCSRELLNNDLSEEDE